MRSYRGVLTRLPRHADAPDPGDLKAARDWIASQPAPRALDLFCGAGGLSLGLRDAGFAVLAGADVDQWAVETHTANVGGLGWVGDLTDPAELLDHLDGWGIDHVDLVAGGVPCQPFSRAGRSCLRDLVASAASEAKTPGPSSGARSWRSSTPAPRAVLVENVPDLPSWDDGTVLMGLYESLAALGYSVDARVARRLPYGVPQHRARLFLVALREARRVRPGPTGVEITIRCATRSAICRRCRGAQRADRISYFRVPAAFRPSSDGCAEMFRPDERERHLDHITRDVRPTTAEAFALLQEGRPTSTCPSISGATGRDIFTDKYKRLAWDELCRTHHRTYRQGRLLVHPSRAAPHALRPRGRDGSRRFPRLVPFRRPAEPPLRADR